MLYSGLCPRVSNSYHPQAQSLSWGHRQCAALHIPHITFSVWLPAVNYVGNQSRNQVCCELWLLPDTPLTVVVTCMTHPHKTLLDHKPLQFTYVTQNMPVQEYEIDCRKYLSTDEFSLPSKEQFIVALGYSILLLSLKWICIHTGHV